MNQTKFLALFTIFAISTVGHCLDAPLSIDELTKILGKDAWEKVQNEKIISSGKVTSSQLIKDKKTQSLDYLVSGLHPKSCKFALRKLSLYEKYNTFLPFIKSSSYDDSRKRINLLLDHSLLPFKMEMDFGIGRIDKPGNYPFYFDKGFLKGLTGSVRVREFKDRCLFVTTATWEGPYTGYPDMILEIAATTISRVGLERLFRLSSNY